VSLADPIIRVSGLTMRFGEDTALNDVDLDVPTGGALALIGPTAAGKTVLLKCILGLHEPERGQIEIAGVDPHALRGEARDRVMHRLGVLFQRNALFDGLTVWENVAFAPLHQNGVSRAEARDRAIELLGKVGLGADAADLFPADLSGGMQKRVGLARAIAGEADILLLDNPTAGLDPILATGIERLIFDIQQERGATLVVVTTEMAGLTTRFDHIALLHDGIMRWSGPTAEAEASGNPYVVQMLRGDRHGPIEMRVTA
jgi:phospholipid/cholesterol/gamma-HCH transport system ATP-binding protein